MLYVRPNIFNWVEIRGIRGVLMTPHSKLFSYRDADLFVDRSIVFHDNWLLNIPEQIFLELLE